MVPLQVQRPSRRGKRQKRRQAFSANPVPFEVFATAADAAAPCTAPRDASPYGLWAASPWDAVLGHVEGMRSPSQQLPKWSPGCWIHDYGLVRPDLRGVSWAQHLHDAGELDGVGAHADDAAGHADLGADVVRWVVRLQ